MPVRLYREPQMCKCGQFAEKVILTAPTGYVQADVCYDSPITGEAITSRAKRIEDMAKHGCTEYDPGMKQDYQRRISEQEKRLDASMDATVNELIEKMPARKRESLAAELASGVEVTPVRQTVEA